MTSASYAAGGWGGRRSTRQFQGASGAGSDIRLRCCCPWTVISKTMLLWLFCLGTFPPKNPSYRFVALQNQGLNGWPDSSACGQIFDGKAHQVYCAERRPFNGGLAPNSALPRTVLLPGSSTLQQDEFSSNLRLSNCKESCLLVFFIGRHLISEGTCHVVKSCSYLNDLYLRGIVKSTKECMPVLVGIGSYVSPKPVWVGRRHLTKHALGVLDPSLGNCNEKIRVGMDAQRFSGLKGSSSLSRGVPEESGMNRGLKEIHSREGEHRLVAKCGDLTVSFSPQSVLLDLLTVGRYGNELIRYAEDYDSSGGPFLGKCTWRGNHSQDFQENSQFYLSVHSSSNSELVFSPSEKSFIADGYQVHMSWAGWRRAELCVSSDF